MHAAHEDAVIALVDSRELPVVHDPRRHPARAGESDNLVRSVWSGAMQRVFVLKLGAAEVEQDTLQSLAVLA